MIRILKYNNITMTITNKQISLYIEKNIFKIVHNWKLIFLLPILDFETRQKILIAKNEPEFIKLIDDYKDNKIILTTKINKYLANISTKTCIIKSIYDKLFQDKYLFIKKETNCNPKIEMSSYKQFKNVLFWNNFKV